MMYFKEKEPNIQGYSVFTPGESLSLLHFYSHFFYEYETLGTMFSLSVGHGKLGCDSCLSLRLNCMHAILFQRV
jgi:hypothetical protein